MNTEFASQVWIQYVTKKLQETEPCSRDFMIGPNLMKIFQKETGVKTKVAWQKITWNGFSFHCFEQKKSQAFDIVYSICLNFETVTENHRLYIASNCTCKNRAENGTHCWIIAPFSLTPEQTEIYTVFRKEGTSPAAAYEIAQNI